VLRLVAAIGEAVRLDGVVLVAPDDPVPRDAGCGVLGLLHDPIDQLAVR
jgi:hypothetical protein